jgi:SAM-dependent methyltransferase
MRRRKIMPKSEVARWDERYRIGDTPWNTGRPDDELQRVLAEEKIRPCRAVELGCGTGTNALWLARQGFDVTAVDISPLAVERARERASAAGVAVRFLVADVLEPLALSGPFGFFFDRGCYHVVRRLNVQRYLDTVEHITARGAQGLVLAGNAREPLDPGPPVVSEEELRIEWGRAFEIVKMREFRFDADLPGGERPLAWSCLLRRV